MQQAKYIISFSGSYNLTVECRSAHSIVPESYAGGSVST
jgi:hypothetical protein